MQNNSLSAIKNEDEQRKSFLINKVGDIEGDNSAIIESNMILGALNGGNRESNIGADLINQSSSFLRNDLGPNEQQPDGIGNDKQVDSSGIMWLSQAPSKEPAGKQKEGSPNKSVSSQADKVTNQSSDNIVGFNSRKHESVESDKLEREKETRETETCVPKSEHQNEAPSVNCIDEQPILPK